MNTYTIIANNIELDTDDKINISLNYEIENILSIEKRSTNWTKTITIPGTKINNKFFNHIYDVNVNMSTFNPLKSVPAYIRCDDNLIFQGYMQLIKVNTQHKDVTYEVTIMGILSNFFTKISNKLLSDLDLSKYNHIRNRDTIIKSFNYDIYENGSLKEYLVPGNGYVYPHIIYGLTTDYYHNMFLKDWFPAVYDKTIVKEIFAQIGINIKSNWLDSEYASKLIYPFVNDKFQLSEEEEYNRGIAIGVIGQPGFDGYYDALPKLYGGSAWTSNAYVLPGWTRETGTVDDVGGELEFKDPSNQFTSSLFTCDKTGYYNVAFDGKLFAKYERDGGGNVAYNVGSGSFEYYYSMEKQNLNGTWIEIAGSTSSSAPTGAVLFAPSDGLSHASPWIDVATPLTTQMAAGNILIQEGEKIRIRYEARYPAGVNWTSGSSNTVSMRMVWKDIADGDDFSKFTIEPASNESLGNEEVNMNQVLPNNIKQSDYILDLIRQFNLIIVDDTEQPNTIIIEPRDDYYANKQTILDWEYERKMDYDGGYTLTPMSELDFTSYDFTYSEDTDYYNKQYTEETKKIFGERIIDIDNDYSDKVSETKLNLAPTPNSSEFMDGRVAPFFVTKDDENFKQMKVKPRRLFYGGMVNRSYLIIQEFPGSPDFDVVQGYPYCGMWDHPTDPNYSLEFGSSDKLYWSTSQFPNYNLYETYHRTTIANITNPNSKLLEAKFRLTPKDIAEFDFRNVVFLMGQYWRVNSIKDYDPVNANKLTTVVLYTLNDVELLNTKTVNIPTSNRSCPTDMVIRKNGKRWVQVSASGLPVTKDCCDSVGGTFVDGVCFIGDKRPSDGVLTPASPISQPTGPNVIRDGNTINSNGVKVNGKNNYVPTGVDPTVQILGNGNTIRPGIKNIIIIGDNKSVKESNGISIDGTFYGSNGIITPNFNMLTGPTDALINLFPSYPLVNVWKSGTDAVRDPDFTSFINLIDGGTDEV